MKIIRLTGADYTHYMKNFDGFKHQMKKALWDAHGNVRITGPSGRFIGIVREDPGVAPALSEEERDAVSDDQMAKEAGAIKRMRNSGHAKSAPSPKACKCVEWPWPEKLGQRPTDDRSKPTTHHPKCAYRSMWERQKGHAIKSVAAGPMLEPTIHRAGKVSNHSVTRASLLGQPARADKLKEKTEKIPHPDTCPKCSSFTKSRRMEQDQHHPTCMYFKKYKAISVARQAIGKPTPKPEAPKPTKDNPLMLINLDTQELVREAEKEEVEEGRRRLRDEGTAFVHVDGEDYLLAFNDGTSVDPLEGQPAQEALIDSSRETYGAEVNPSPASKSDTERPADNVNEADDPDLQGVNEEHGI